VTGVLLFKQRQWNTCVNRKPANIFAECYTSRWKLFWKGCCYF